MSRFTFFSFISFFIILHFLIILIHYRSIFEFFGFLYCSIVLLLYVVFFFLLKLWQQSCSVFESRCSIYLELYNFYRIAFCRTYVRYTNLNIINNTTRKLHVSGSQQRQPTVPARTHTTQPCTKGCLVGWQRSTCLRAYVIHDESDRQFLRTYFFSSRLS